MPVINFGNIRLAYNDACNIIPYAKFRRTYENLQKKE